MCDICAFSFDSNFSECKKCEYYQEALDKYGKTKTNQQYQIEMIMEAFSKTSDSSHQLALLRLWQEKLNEM